jgi:hypothetical protein
MPDNVDAAALLPFSYPAAGPDMSPHRQPVEEVTFAEKWGQRRETRTLRDRGLGSSVSGSGWLPSTPRAVTALVRIKFQIIGIGTILHSGSSSDNSWTPGNIAWQSNVRQHLAPLL